MHFEETTDVKLAMLFNEVLVLRGRPSEAEALVGQVVEASRAINGAIHVVTMCAVEGQAAVLVAGDAAAAAAAAAAGERTGGGGAAMPVRWLTDSTETRVVLVVVVPSAAVAVTVGPGSVTGLV